MKKFEMPKETVGERWSREARKESPILSFLVGMAAGIVIVFVVIVLGSESNAYAVYKRTDISLEASDHSYTEQTVSIIEPEENENIEQPEEVYEVEEYEYTESQFEPIEPDPGYFEYETWEQPDSFVSNYYQESGAQEPDDSNLRVDGVQYSDDGTRYTWYSQNVLPGGGLDIPGRGVDENGYVVDGDGNLCVASSDHDLGTMLETPYGTAVVYDTGCPNGTVDVYTNW